MLHPTGPWWKILRGYDPVYATNNHVKFRLDIPHPREKQQHRENTVSMYTIMMPPWPSRNVTVIERGVNGATNQGCDEQTFKNLVVPENPQKPVYYLFVTFNRSTCQFLFRLTANFNIVAVLVPGAQSVSSAESVTCALLPHFQLSKNKK